MVPFVNKSSIVREIWSNSDTLLFIFAGASAEFALNKEVDWLYFTGKLPTDPLGRMLSTIAYSQQIIFSEANDAFHTIDRINRIHNNVEESRGKKIPEWAYRDVLYMLIDYSIRSYELLERKLSEDEKIEVYGVFYQVGKRMGIQNLPPDYQKWLPDRNENIQHNLVNSFLTQDLYKQYKKSLGWTRYKVLLQAQIMIVPKGVNKLLKLGTVPFLFPIIQIYKLTRKFHLNAFIRNFVLPEQIKGPINNLSILYEKQQKVACPFSKTL